MQVKVNVADIDCWANNEIVCPFCGAEQGDSWEYGNGEDIGEVECDHCSRTFYAERNISISYASRPLSASCYASWDKGDVFDDGIESMEDEAWANEHGKEPCEIVEK